MEEWKTIEPNVWKPENEGDQVSGVVINKAPKDESANLSARYYLNDGKTTLLIWGTAVINDRMQYVNIGDKVRITYKGKIQNKRSQSMNLYTVEIAQNRQPEHDEANRQMEEPQEEQKVASLGVG